MDKIGVHRFPDSQGEAAKKKSPEEYVEQTRPVVEAVQKERAAEVKNKKLAILARLEGLNVGDYVFVLTDGEEETGQHIEARVLNKKFREGVVTKTADGTTLPMHVSIELFDPARARNEKDTSNYDLGAFAIEDKISNRAQEFLDLHVPPQEVVSGISFAQNFKELFAALSKLRYGLAGTKKFYPTAELKTLINRVRGGESPDLITSAGGLYEAVTRLLAIERTKAEIK